MANPAHILVIEDSDVTRIKLKAVLGYLGYFVTTQATAEEALAWLNSAEALPDAILSDIILPGLSGIDLTRKLRSTPATAQITIILMTINPDAELVAAGREAGSDDFLNKTISPKELDSRIQAALASRTPQPVKIELPHQTISIFSLRGGAGTTSLAINLAIGLKRLWDAESTLWDLAFSTGACSTLLALESSTPPPDWTDGLASPSPVADLLLSHESGIRLLPAPVNLAQAEKVSKEAVEAVWKSVQEASNYLVVDGGHHLTPALEALLPRSDQVLLPLTPDPAGIKSARDALDRLSALGVDPEKCLLISNATFPEYALSKTRINYLLKKKVAVEIPYDGEHFSYAAFSGKPLLLSAPKSDAAWAIMLLAYQISKKDVGEMLRSYSTPLLEEIQRREWANSI